MRAGKLLLIFFILDAVALLGYAGWRASSLLSWYEQPFGEAGKTVTLVVPNGTTINGAMNLLEKRGLIAKQEDRKYLRHLIKDLPAPRAGEFEVETGQSPKELLTALSQAVEKQYQVTVPEGLRIEEIAVLVEQAGFGKAKTFIHLCKDPLFAKKLGVNASTLEGYLLPETYGFPKNFAVEKVIERMVESTFQVMTPDVIAKYKSRNLTVHQAVTLASIVEKETGAPKERPLIASVYLNRLKKGMLLQADPTVIYGIRNFDGNLRRSHLNDKNNPYNTYARAGLPPGPIANPGKEALLAVANPKKSDYLYFVAMNNGRHKFSKTLKEHNAAVHKYQIRGEVGPK